MTKQSERSKPLGGTCSMPPAAAGAAMHAEDQEGGETEGPFVGQRKRIETAGRNRAPTEGVRGNARGRHVVSWCMGNQFDEYDSEVQEIIDALRADDGRLFRLF